MALVALRCPVCRMRMVAPERRLERGIYCEHCHARIRSKATIHCARILGSRWPVLVGVLLFFATIAIAGAWPRATMASCETASQADAAACPRRAGPYAWQDGLTRAPQRSRQASEPQPSYAYRLATQYVLVPRPRRQIEAQRRLDAARKARLTDPQEKDQAAIKDTAARQL